ncbi:MAG: hypothetical protein K2Q03_03575 [Sphingobacteriaceae bacterium]|nr:hypothetical protein [Sphingobacteriaceae bacterium]
MKEHIQSTGVRKWYANDLLELQSETLLAVQQFFGNFGNHIISGCNISNNTISDGLVAISHEDGFKVAKLTATNITSFPAYIIIAKNVINRDYQDTTVKPIVNHYEAKIVYTIPTSGYILLKADNSAIRFLDAIQNPNYRMTSDLEKSNWNAKADKTAVDLQINDLGVQIEAAKNGLTYKDGCRVVLVNDVDLTGLLTVDGVTLLAGNRVLVSIANGSVKNGIYVANVGAWTRATDANTATKLKPNTTIWVAEGTLYKDTQWTMTNDTLTLGTTALLFVQSQRLFKIEGANVLQDATNRLVSDTEKATWNGKADKLPDNVKMSLIFGAFEVGNSSMLNAIALLMKELPNSTSGEFLASNSSLHNHVQFCKFDNNAAYFNVKRLIVNTSGYNTPSSIDYYCANGVIYLTKVIY